MDDYLKIVAAGPAFFVSAWLLMIFGGIAGADVGHQPWLSSPSFVVQVWAGGYGSASVVRQMSANTFKVTKPDGKTFTVTGVRPVSVPGPWVITKIA
jgi:hypothetical protein